MEWKEADLDCWSLDIGFIYVTILKISESEFSMYINSSRVWPDRKGDYFESLQSAKLRAERELREISHQIILKLSS
jgi:hypothetical protein